MLIMSESSSDLFDNYINLISILHVEVLGSLVFVKSITVKKEPYIISFDLDEHKSTDCL